MTETIYNCGKSGHWWVKHSANDTIDDNGNVTACGSWVAFTGDKQYRTCKICKRKEVLVPERWEEVK